ncbi:MAG: aminomethyl-transferring glycine dehydrogenase subunit GcvPB [Candidatus Methanofastidiosia archaeon]
MYRQAKYAQETVFEISKEGRKGYSITHAFGDILSLPKGIRRIAPPDLPELSEIDVVRHFIKLSQMNYGVDTGFYPLGSCTMKYNPKINEELASHEMVTEFHPLSPKKSVQGNLELMWRLSRMLCEISGTDEITLQPAAGAQAEFLGAKMISFYHKKNDEERDEMVVPDSAHGTNPASSAMAGFRVVEVPSGDDGEMDIGALEAAVSERTAGLMLTNPNTLGIFESKIGKISEIVHDAGGLLYYDGANLNALLGKARPGDMGFDIVHFNLHKTFSTPHGGGGPGAGAIGVKNFLRDFLPVPIVVKDKKGFKLDYGLKHSIGKVRSFYGNFAVLVRAYAYLVSLGSEMSRVADFSVLNSNYLAALLKDHFEIPYYSVNPLRKHEFVVSCEKIKRETGVAAADIARRLLDFGVHAPTAYFPLIVKEALMIEPTETESREELENFANVLIAIKKECYENPEIVRSSPHNTSCKKLDIVKAAREPVLSWRMFKER